MKNAFLDTNVVIDFLADRHPFSLAAAEIFNASVGSKVKLYISAVSFNNIYYILRQSLSHNRTIKLLDELCEITEVANVTDYIIKKSLRSGFSDFEDAIQYYCASSLNIIDFIITRNSKDFKKSAIPIVSAEEAISIINNED
jgi:predicted nucleic acid-binding protein